MIAGKTESEILLMKRWTRCRWYKTILPEEKEEAMQIVKVIGLAKYRKTTIGTRSGKNNPMYGKTGEDNPNFGSTRTEETCTKMRAAWTPERKFKQSGENNSAKRPETRDKMREWWTSERRAEMGDRMRGKLRPQHSERMKGKNHWNWQSGKSFEPYGLEFNGELKEQIRKRDKYTCQECGKTQDELGRELDVHHIDYDKTNNKLENLISLCRSCHSKTNYEREDWTKYFEKIMKLSLKKEEILEDGIFKE